MDLIWMVEDTGGCNRKQKRKQKDLSTHFRGISGMLGTVISKVVSLTSF